MKKVLLVMLALAMVLSVAACSQPAPAASSSAAASVSESASAAASSSAPASSDASASTSAASNGKLAGKSVAICTATATHGFNSELIVHAQNTIKKLAAEYGFTAKVVTCEDSTAQVNALETLKGEGHDMIMVSAVVGEDIRAVCNDIIASGTKLFVFSRAIGNIQCPEYLGDQYGMGKTQADYLLNFFKDDIAAGKDIQVLEFYGDDSVNSQERSRGLNETLNAKGVKVNQKFRCDWARQKSMENMENWLSNAQGKDISNIRAIVTQDDEISYGIMDAIEQTTSGVDLSKLNLFVSIGSQKNWLDKMDEYKTKYGITLAGLDYAPTYAIKAIEMGVQWLAGEVQLEPKDYTFIPAIVDASKKAEYMNSDTFKTRYSIFDDKGNLIAK